MENTVTRTREELLTLVEQLGYDDAEFMDAKELAIEDFGDTTGIYELLVEQGVAEEVARKYVHEVEFRDTYTAGYNRYVKTLN